MGQDAQGRGIPSVSPRKVQLKVISAIKPGSRWLKEKACRKVVVKGEH